jgi:hypothetical protein
MALPQAPPGDYGEFRLPDGRCISLICRVLFRKMALLCHTVVHALESMAGNAEQSSKSFYQIKSFAILMT